MKKIVCYIFISLLFGCATYKAHVPEIDIGPSAVIRDSSNTLSTSKIEFFYVETINDKNTSNARSKSISQNQGRGLYIEPSYVSRKVSSRQPVKLVLVARTTYAAPIQSITNSIFMVKGDLVFTPEANKTYTVTGTITDNYSAVWLQDDSTKEVVGKKIEINGSAKLGFFEK
jgi:hypothetical protein